MNTASLLRRELLTQFLKEHRARIKPSDVGLPEPSRQRAPGLRREDIASLTGMSVTWYTWLEQGRELGVSHKVLERLCDVLKLEPHEREYLFTLVHSRPAPIRPREPIEAPPCLVSMIESLNIPALVMSFRWDIVAWNRLIAIFHDYDKLPPEGRNFLRILVTDPIYRKDPRRGASLAIGIIRSV